MVFLSTSLEKRLILRKCLPRSVGHQSIVRSFSSMSFPISTLGEFGWYNVDGPHPGIVSGQLLPPWGERSAALPCDGHLALATTNEAESSRLESFGRQFPHSNVF